MIKGNSGCTLKVIGENIIQKKCESSYNTRLEMQMQKQITNKKNLQKVGFDVPEIYRHGIDRNCFYFNMEYYRYNNFIDYFMFNSIDKIQYFTDSIIRLVRNYHDTSSEKKISFSVTK